MSNKYQLPFKKTNIKKNKILENTLVFSSDLPFVSLCTPTFNRRPFFEGLIRSIRNQKYPASKMEWIIVDDGFDKVEDLFENLKNDESFPNIKYFYHETKMKLGEKRNEMHKHCEGEFIVYLDDDDYYPPTRVSHAVEMLLQNPKALCAGSSEMYIYFKHIHSLYQTGPYGPNHATAATFAFRKQMLLSSHYDNSQSLSEEKYFLKDFTVPFVQLDPKHTILVFSHIHNSFDKSTMLERPSKYVNLSSKTIDYFVVEPEQKDFYLHKINQLLINYEPGQPVHKPDILLEIIDRERTLRRLAETQYLEQMSKSSKMPSLVINDSKQKLIDAQFKRISELNQTLELRDKEIAQLKKMFKI